ncbi:MAG: hypothetical protein LHV69_00515 [Elusimicrobia bacterium]|nr:hypothetical protein [Candidatus Obscuribacterium magneticum]
MNTNEPGIKESYPESPLWPRNKIQVIKDHLRWIQWKITNLGESLRTFNFDGHSYPYFWHNYNRTWKNERAVEIPILREIVQEYGDRRTLEFGNVLSHYFPVRHDIVDKFETIKGVINQDIIDFHPSQPYDLIFSISTLEHVGWDESPRQPEKVFIALDKLLRLLSPQGVFVFTMPPGHNSLLDTYLQSQDHPFDKLCYMKRISAMNDWVEVDGPTAWKCQYGHPFPAANGLVIGFHYKKDKRSI